MTTPVSPSLAQAALAAKRLAEHNRSRRNWATLVVFMLYLVLMPCLLIARPARINPTFYLSTMFGILIAVPVLLLFF